ncbi:MAG: quinone oxidoreductase family protein, partial [Acidimicrobiia bacterium]
MKAAVYYETGPPEVLRYEDIADPVCYEGGVVVAVEAISIEGGDTLNRAGGDMPAVPHVVGYQCAGTIREVGAGVADRHVGQRVVATNLWGSHAELNAVPAILTWPIPDGADIIAAACVPVAFGTADDCLFEFGHLRAGETVLIQAGAGGVGIAAIQLAKRAGATVIATASSDGRLERVKEFGLDYGINYSHDDWVDQVRALTSGRGVELVVDSVGGRILSGSVQCLAYRGRCISVGSAGRDPQPFDAGALSMGNQSLTGVFLGAEIATDRAHNMIQRLVDEAARGEYKVVIDRTFPLSEAAAAHAYI